MCSSLQFGGRTGRFDEKVTSNIPASGICSDPGFSMGNGNGCTCSNDEHGHQGIAERGKGKGRD